MKTQHEDSNDRLVRKLRDSSIYKIYEKAFREATGLTLMLQPVATESWRTPCQDGNSKNTFCQMLNSGSSACGACVRSRCGLAGGAEDRLNTVGCFAGMRESAIPIKIGNSTVAYLMTGQIFHQRPTAADFKKVATGLLEQGFSPDEVSAMKSKFLNSPVIEANRYTAMLTLLAAFAMQLAGLANGIMIENTKQEPSVVIKAKQYIMANLEESLSLETLADHVGVSPFYFCKIFKQATSMTFTEYVNRRRVERAKRRLMAHGSRVTEIAYDIGYQSLSQFNRSFLKYVGESPSKFRDHARGAQPQLVA
jgi:AraC-like DNA-binding protein/ligand-binding sensor protein